MSQSCRSHDLATTKLVVFNCLLTCVWQLQAEETVAVAVEAEAAEAEGEGSGAAEAGAASVEGDL